MGVKAKPDTDCIDVDSKYPVFGFGAQVAHQENKHEGRNEIVSLPVLSFSTKQK